MNICTGILAFFSILILDKQFLLKGNLYFKIILNTTSEDTTQYYIFLFECFLRVPFHCRTFFHTYFFFLICTFICFCQSKTIRPKCILRKVQVGNDQEKAQSEKQSHSNNRGRKKN